MGNAYPDDEAGWKAERRAKRLALLDARLPEAFRADGALHPDVTSWASKLAAGGHSNLAMVGATGSGKTWHAWHAARGLLEAGWDGRIDFVTADDFRARTSPRSDQSHLWAIEMMADAELLVLDDIGAYRASDWWTESMYAVINHRYEHMMPTVLTSNVADLRDALGERMASRLSEDLVFVVLDVPDRRRQP